MGKYDRTGVYSRYFFGMKHWRRVLGIGCAIGLVLGFSIESSGEPAEEPDQPVAAVQALLRRERLYSGPVDGVVGAETVAAVRRYQIRHGLRVTGHLDPATLRVMLLPPQASPELTASDMELLRELAQTPPPAPVAERRIPIPPGEPVAATPGAQKQKDAKKNGRSKSPKARRSSGMRNSD